MGERTIQNQVAVAIKYGNLQICGFSICSGVCNSHGVLPLASSIDSKSYFLARGKTPCKATPPLLRLRFVARIGYETNADSANRVNFVIAYNRSNGGVAFVFVENFGIKLD